MRLLIIEDDLKINDALVRALRSEGFAVDSAFDGVAGEELASVNEYDAIILDVLMPRQDGWETCAILRRNNVMTPILMLTALDDVSDKIKGFSCGTDDYLAKPFHFSELIARIRSLVRRHSQVRTNQIEKYGLLLDLDAHKAIRAGQEISLTTKEFALLELFMLHPGKILSRETISEHLWDMNFDPQSNVIDSFVKLLRQKVDKGFDQPLIHTVRGAGYRFFLAEQ
jgi:DNA-binding response OmpR family regulator